MIFDKLFGKKHKEEVENNDLNKIKKVIYQPKQNLNIASGSLGNSLNENNNLFNNHPNNVLNNNVNNVPLNNSNSEIITHANNNSIPTNNSTVNPVNSNLITNSTNSININNNSNDFKNQSNIINEVNSPINREIQNNIPSYNPNSKDEHGIVQLDNKQHVQIPVPTQKAINNNEINLADLSIDEELKKLEQDLLKEQSTTQHTQVLQSQKINDNAVVLNVKEEEKEDHLSFEELKKRSKEYKKEEQVEEDEGETLFIRLDKYEETLKLIENIRHKIEENEHILEKIVELKKEEDIKLEKWRNELTKINRNLLKIYTTLKKVK